MELPLSKMICDLQNYAHEGYALHSVGVVAACPHCDTEVVIEDPEMKVVVDEETKSVKLVFSTY